MFFLIPPLIIYTLAVLMPSWRWLLVYSFVLVLLYGFLSSQPMDGAGGFIGLIWLLLMAGAGLAGIIANTLHLLCRQHRPRLARFFPWVGLPVYALAVLIPSWLDEHQQQPDQACRQAQFTLSLGEQYKAHLMDSPLFWANLGPFYHTGSFTNMVGFAGRYLKETCDKTNNGALPLQISLLKVDFLELNSSRFSAEWKSFCQQSKPWIKEVCDLKKNKKRFTHEQRDWPFPYAFILYDHRKYQPVPPDSKEELSYQESQRQAGHSPEQQKTYWVSPNPAQHMKDGLPWTVACLQDHCYSIIALDEHIRLKMHWRGFSPDNPSTAWQQYQKVETILNDILLP